ncbi:hypothetical protein [Cribrihabitans neustonicus]|uniref:hypothetical protein n=1 Tax=Cribrihabitans neustonicus TaxID=1429085 RepID=UPI003B592B8B
MRHLLLTAALVSAAAAPPLLANDSMVEQIGAGNTATVTQTGGTGGSSDIYQTGDDDSASVIQSDGGGSGTNIAEIDQLGGSGIQTASITQANSTSGAVNTATILQDSTEGGNSAEIEQTGSDNTAAAQQGPGAASSGPPASITNSSTEIIQAGTGNTATTDQIVGSNGGDNNQASITQSGSFNTAGVIQGTGTAATGGLGISANDNDNSATILQDGLSHMSNIEQGGESGTALNTQFGDSNESAIVQSGGIPISGANSAIVNQDGSGNFSVVNQTSDHGDLPAVPALTSAIVTQSGNLHVSTINQAPVGGHMATVLQDGASHESLINQDGLDNKAYLTQELSGQVSEIHQTDLTFLGSTIDNTATVTQTASSGNMSFITQMGVQNTSTVMQ